MASTLGRYLVATPETSQAFRNALQNAIDDGSLQLPLVLTDIETHESLETVFTLSQTRYRAMSTEFVGTLQDRGIATVVAMTHPELSDSPARLTLVRRSTP